VAEAEGRLDGHGDAGERPDLGPTEKIGLASLLEHLLQLERGVEVVLDRVFPAPRDDHDPFEPRRARFLDDVLDERPVHQRQHLLGLRLGGGEEPRPQPRGGENGDSHGSHRGEILTDRGEVSG
jgi:hypothetical protein